MFLLFPTNAYAHAQLISTNPMPNSVQAKTPEKLILEFGEQMLDFENGNSITVLAPSGKELTTGETILNGAIIYRNLLESSEVGNFKVSYRAISNDGHKVSGEFEFKVAKSVTNKAKSDENLKVETSTAAKLINQQETLGVKSSNSTSINHFWHHHRTHILWSFGGLAIIFCWAWFRRMRN